MGDVMTFPASVEEFMEQYKITDTEHVYSNGTEFVPIYRMKQWFEHINYNGCSDVRHGRWVDGHCSECGADATFTTWTEPVYDYDWEENLCYSHDEIHNEYNETNYCPNCGTLMDLEKMTNGTMD